LVSRNRSWLLFPLPSPAGLTTGHFFESTTRPKWQTGARTNAINRLAASHTNSHTNDLPLWDGGPDQTSHQQARLRSLFISRARLPPCAISRLRALESCPRSNVGPSYSVGRRLLDIGPRALNNLLVGRLA